MQERQPSEFLKSYPAQKSNFNQQTHLSEVSSNPVAPSEPIIRADGYWLFPTLLLGITWAAALISKSIFLKTVRTDKKSSIKPYPKIPCLNCRFFNNDVYLRCVVHPSKALSIEASNCMDYWSLDSNKFANSQIEDD
ncbi:MAG TPA: hypothetical protein V6C91_17110 [Coleofasciculaceae cyanobacterium]